MTQQQSRFRELRHSDFWHSSLIRGFGFRHCFGIRASALRELNNPDARMTQEFRNPNPRIKSQFRNPNEETRMRPFGTAAKRIAVLVALVLAAASPAATIHKTDDSNLTGDLLSISDGKLTISAKPAPVVVPLDEIMQISMKGTPTPCEVKPAAVAKPTAPPAAEDDTVNSNSVLGSLFGSHTATPKKPPVPAPPVLVHEHAATTGPTTQIANAPMVQMTLTDGDVLHAKLLSWSDQQLSLKLTAGPSLNVPSTSVTQIWLGTADLLTKARALTLEPGPEDVAFVAKEKEVVAVKGLVQGVEGESLKFRYGDEDRKIGLAKLVGVLLRSNSPAPLAGFHQLVHIESGDQFSGSLTGIDHDVLLLTTPASAAPMRIQLSSISTIDFLNGRVSSLCDLKPAKVEQTPYFNRVMPYQIDKSLTGGPLVLSDGPIARGIAVHSRCVLEFDVSSGFDRFKTRLGFQLPDGQAGRVLARVLGDGKVLYENADLRGDQPAVDLDLSLTGVKTLTLLIDFGKDQDVGDRVVWGNPRLLRGK
jgi:hypothetical protein